MTSPHAPLTRSQERLAVAALAMGAFVMGLNANVLAALFTFVDDDLEVGSAAWGGLLASAGIAGAVGALLLGPWVDRAGRRPPLLAGLALFVVGSAAHLFARDLGELYAARIVAGFAGGVAMTGASAAVADLVPYVRRGAAMGVFSAGLFLAVSVGMPMAHQFAKSGWWRGTFLVQALLGAAAFVAMLRFLPAGVGRGGKHSSQLAVARRPMVLPALLSGALFSGAFFTTVQFAGKWLDEQAILPKDDQLWLWVALGVAAAVGSLGLARLSDALGKRNFVLVTTAALAVGLLLLRRVDSPTMLVAVGLPIALLGSARAGPFTAIMSQMVPGNERGVLMGVRSASITLGMGLFAWIGGATYEDSGFGLWLYVAAGCCVVSFFLVRVFVREEALHT